MKNLKYINDKEFKYNEDVIKGLQSYNKNQTGYREKNQHNFYVFEEDDLVAACQTDIYSDWCGINKLYYRDIDTLKALINDVRKFYRDSVEGIQFNSVSTQRAIDFEEIGFNIQGKLKNMPSGNDNVFLVDRELDNLEVNEDYTFETSKKPIPPYHDVFKEKIKKQRKSLDFSTEKIDIQFITLDKDMFVGGIYGHFQFEYLFINVLFVNKHYRGNRIASKLMNLIETEALNRGVTNVYLTTFEFQARGFYVKHGYKVVMTIEDYPKGFAEYTLYKKLNK